MFSPLPPKKRVMHFSSLERKKWKKLFFHRCSNTNKFPPYSVKKKKKKSSRWKLYREAIEKQHEPIIEMVQRKLVAEFLFFFSPPFFYSFFFFREREMIGWPIEMQIGPRLFRCTRSPVTTAQIRSFPSPMGFSVSQTTRCRSKRKKEGVEKKISKPIVRNRGLFLLRRNAFNFIVCVLTQHEFRRWIFSTILSVEKRKIQRSELKNKKKGIIKERGFKQFRYILAILNCRLPPFPRIFHKEISAKIRVHGILIVRCLEF